MHERSHLTAVPLGQRLCRQCPALLEAGEPGRLCPRCQNLDRLAEVLDDVDLSPWPDAASFVGWVVRSAPEAQFEGLVDLLRLLRGGPKA